jgi:hypothetical protein
MVKKGNTTAMQMVRIDARKNGKTIAVSKGEVLKITLGNPGDGGYSFDAPQYNSSVLTLLTTPGSCRLQEQWAMRVKIHGNLKPWHPGSLI